MNTNYKIVADPQRLQDFCRWLPELLPHETYYVALFCRRKYAPDAGLSGDKSQLRAFTTTPQNLMRRLLELECAAGTYKVKDVPVPQQALSAYISVNPRDMTKAAKASLIRFAGFISEPYSGYNPHLEVLSQLQQSTGTKHFIDLDFDGVDLQETLTQVRQHINPDCVQVLHTRGGFHLLVNLSRLDRNYEKTWYRNLSAIPGCDIKGDNLIPIPGCSQGGFVPFITQL